MPLLQLQQLGFESQTMSKRSESETMENIEGVDA